MPLDEVLGLYVVYSDLTPSRAQEICNGLTSLLLEQNQTERRMGRDNTMDFFQKQVEEGRSTVQALHAQLLKREKEGVPRNLEGKRSNQRLISDYDNARRNYATLLDKLNMAKAADDVEKRELENAPLHVLNPASLPEASAFPNRLLFAVAGLGAGLVFGIGLLFA